METILVDTMVNTKVNTMVNSRGTHAHMDIRVHHAVTAITKRRLQAQTRYPWALLPRRAKLQPLSLRLKRKHNRLLHLQQHHLKARWHLRRSPWPGGTPAHTSID